MSVVGKQSEAKRRAKLKVRRKRAEAVSARLPAIQSNGAGWCAASDAASNIIAELVDEEGSPLAYIEGKGDESWTVVVGDMPVAGAADEFDALGMFLIAAVDDQADGNKSYMQFSPWLIEEIEKRCEAANMEWHDFLRALLPREKRLMALPPQQMM